MLRDLVRDPSTSIDEIAAHLDALDPTTRLEDVCTLGRADQASLYDKAASSPRLEPAHFVPDDTPLAPVIHEGWNTLPLGLRSLRRFQKPFCRAGDGSPRMFGYNEGVTRSLLGPGYFVAYDCTDHPEWSARGSWVVDYFQVPDHDVPDAWPEVRPNSRGLQMFVYKGTRDFMRRVSDGVSIGAAYKGERPMNQYFILVRSAL